MMSASALLGVMAFLIAHELIRTPNEKYSGERVALKPVFLSNKTPECSAADSYMDFLLNSEQLPWRTGWRGECQKNRRDKRSLANTTAGRKSTPTTPA